MGEVMHLTLFNFTTFQLYNLSTLILKNEVRSTKYGVMGEVMHLTLVNFNTLQLYNLPTFKIF
jgi:hypothetical protein